MAAPPVSHDFNADGSNDYPVSIIGHDPAAPVLGAARIWSGATKSVIDTIVGDEVNTLFGWSLGSAGDLNADGSDDLIVGEPLWGPNGTLQGRVRVFSGADGSVLLTAVGPYLETGLGRYVAGIGDWNGDGTPDIVSSGWDIADLDNDGIGDDAIGIVYVLSGADGSVLAEIFEPTATPLFGYSVFGLGDITGDGLADIAVVDRGAEGAPGSGAIGRLYIFTGRTQTAQLSTADAHRTILNSDPTLRGFAAQVDTMHPDLWLDEPTLQIISLTSGGTGGPNEAPTAVTIRKADGQFVGSKGIRPTLVLAGDVNLDGKVNALDLQASIAQLGTNPQAIGVMPLADLNNDNIVDTHDVVLLLQDYGEETDIYEGLWDGSRLLAVVGGSAGFGTIGGGGLAGNWGIEPGRRPVDDCLRAMPDNNGPSPLHWLLRQDARANCAQCPRCDGPDPQECYKCHRPGRITGGQITATPEQPKPGDTVVFSWTPFELVGRSRKCQTSCGGDDDDVCVDPPVTLGSSWVIERKNPLTGDWEEILNSMISTVAQTTQQACAEIRLRLTSQSFDAIPPNCAAVEAVQKLKEVQFASFTLAYECTAITPTNNVRTTIGIFEEVIVKIQEPGVVADWSAVIDGHSYSSPGTTDVIFNASRSPSSIEVIATVNGCSRKVRFNVIAPEKVVLTRVNDPGFHIQGRPSAGMAMCWKVLPQTVSFTGLIVGEGECLPTHASGDFSGWSNWVHPSWTNVLGQNNSSAGADYGWFMLWAHTVDYFNSLFEWPIPWEYYDGFQMVEFDITPGRYELDRFGHAIVRKAGNWIGFDLWAPTVNGQDFPSPGPGSWFGSHHCP